MAKDIDPRTLPEFREEPGNVMPAPAPAMERSTKNGGYAPSRYVIEKLRAFNLADIKRVIGLDIEEMIAHPTDYGVLEALATGAQTPVPLTLHQNGMDFLATVRLYKTSKSPGWNSEIHSTRKVPALDGNGQPKLNAKGETVMVYDRNPLKKGDVLEFDGVKLTPDQMDHLRLTGNLGELKTVTTSDGREYRFLVSVDPYNNHQLCRTGTGVVKAGLLRPITTKSAGGQTVTLNPTGCTRDASGAIVTKVNFSFPGAAADGGAPAQKAAVAGELFIRVGGPAEVKIATPAGAEDTVRLTEAQVGRLSPSVTTGRGEERVISYLDAKQVEELAGGNGVWVGGNRDMSFIVTGTRASASIVPVTDRNHSAYVQYDAARGKVLQNLDFKFAKEREVKAEQAQSRAQAQAQAHQEDIQVGMHV